MGESERLVPQEWAENVLLQMKPEGGFYAQFVSDFFGIEFERPKLSRRKRLKIRFQVRRDRLRERIALKVAPWLYTDPY